VRFSRLKRPCPPSSLALLQVLLGVKCGLEVTEPRVLASVSERRYRQRRGASAREFIKVAGSKLGLAAAKTAVRNWVRAGARATEITWEDAEKAGEYLLKIPEVPIADALIAAQAARLSATVVSDDHHFRALGVRVTWYKR